MKNTVICILFALFVSACSKFDVNSFNQRIADADEKISQMEVLAAKINSEISGLATILEEAKAGNLILSCVPTQDGQGYTISFSDGQVVTVTNGNDGIDGTDGKDSTVDGVTPSISVIKDHTGEYCWTVNGSFLTDSVGNHIYVSINATQGKDGIVPMLRVLDGKWQVSYTGGEVWLDLTDSSKGSPYLFKQVQVDGAIVNFTLVNDDVFSLYRLVDPKLGIYGWEDVPVVPNRSIVVTYTVDGASPLTAVRAVANSGLKASVKSEGIDKGSITIQAPATLGSGDVLVTADNGYGRVSMKKISFKEGTILVSDIEAIAGMDPFTW